LPPATISEGPPVVGEAETATVEVVAVPSLVAVVDGAAVVDAGTTVVVDWPPRIAASDRKGPLIS